MDAIHKRATVVRYCAVKKENGGCVSCLVYPVCTKYNFPNMGFVKLAIVDEALDALETSEVDL